MISLLGKGVSPGIGKGPLHFVKLNTEEKYSANTDEEKQRISEAVEESLNQLQEITNIYSNNETISQVLQVHTMLTEDASFLSRIDRILSEEECNAEYAVYQASIQISDELSKLSDDYISERGADVRDVADRIISNLTEERDLLELMDTKAIIVAEELYPSHILHLDIEKTAGVIFKKGSENSHAAILLRSLGIPAVFDVSGNLSEYYEGLFTYIDGSLGTVEILPDEETEIEYEKRDESRLVESKYYESKYKEDITSSGKILNILCNVNLVKDLKLVCDYNASGIGLFRTEFLFLVEDKIPSETHQYEIYKQIISSMNGKKVVIRTLDIGEDKTSVLLHNVNVDGSKKNDNGIRFCLNRQELFKTQLKAILRASAFGNTNIVLPGVMTREEIIKTKDICKEIIMELSDEGINVNNVPIGAMIETKEALENISELAKEADFFSVGTNDLSVALSDKGLLRSEVSKEDICIDNVLAAIKTVSEEAKKNNICVSICGEMASDEKLLPFFLETGIDEISVNPYNVLKLRYFLNDL